MLILIAIWRLHSLNFLTIVPVFSFPSVLQLEFSIKKEPIEDKEDKIIKGSVFDMSPY